MRHPREARLPGLLLPLWELTQRPASRPGEGRKGGSGGGRGRRKPGGAKLECLNPRQQASKVTMDASSHITK